YVELLQVASEFDEKLVAKLLRESFLSRGSSQTLDSELLIPEKRISSRDRESAGVGLWAKRHFSRVANITVLNNIISILVIIK
ncbi:hypothetical protein ACJX0J_028262, partial [Zea mays]